MRRLAALVPFMLLAVLANAANDPAVPAKADPCAAKESHQFDFWIGDWNVVDPAGKVAGHNRIEAILGGCALAEHWDGAGGGTARATTPTTRAEVVAAVLGRHTRRRAASRRHVRRRAMVLRSPRADTHVDRHHLDAEQGRDRASALGDVRGQRKDLDDIVRRALRAHALSKRTPAARRGRRGIARKVSANRRWRRGARRSSSSSCWRRGSSRSMQCRSAVPCDRAACARRCRSRTQSR